MAWRSLLLAPAPKKRYSKWTELSFGISSRNNWIVVHDVSSRLFVRRLENCNPCIDPTECRTGKDQDAVVKELLKPQKVVLPDLLLLIGDRCGEVVARWVQEIDPFRHPDRFAQPRWRFNLGPRPPAWRRLSTVAYRHLRRTPATTSAGRSWEGLHPVIVKACEGAPRKRNTDRSREVPVPRPQSISPRTIGGPGTLGPDRCLWPVGGYWSCCAIE